jgi:hypothetical protein
MNLPTDPESPAALPTSPCRPRRPWWYWLLLFLPPAVAVIPVVFDWAVYRSAGGTDGTRGLASGITFGLAGLTIGLFTAVFLAAWEARHHSGKTPAVLVAIGTFVFLQFLNLGLAFGGCMLGLRAVDSIMR